MTSILFGIMRTCRSRFKCNYLKNENLFLNVLFLFYDLNEILTIFKQKMIVIANVFPKLETVTDVVRPISKKRRFRTSFDIQHVKTSQTLVKSARKHFYHIFSSLWREINWEINLLLFLPFLESIANSKHFRKKVDCHS